MSVNSAFSLYSEATEIEDKNENCSQNGAMLSMLAEVATQTLRADKAGSYSPSLPTPAKKKRSRQANGMPLHQAKMLSGNQLVRTFSRCEGDELKRTFSFQCLLIPKKCCARFESFGSETKARNCIKDHLLTHLDELPDGEILEVPKQQEEIAYRETPIVISKSNRKIKTLKPVEIKNCDIPAAPSLITEVIIENQPKTPICMTLEECFEELQVNMPEETQGADVSVGPLTPDHDYFQSQTVPDLAMNCEEYTDVETIWIKSENKDNINSGITNYVFTDSDNVENDPMLSVSNEVIVHTEDEDMNVINNVQNQIKGSYVTIKSNELPVLQDNRLLDGEKKYEENCVERDEHRLHKKPKGKAKFIGQSAAEKEMAVRMIEAMKLKQGSSEPLECQICVPPRVFTAPTTLISHYRSHAGIKPYECHLCGGVFTRQHSLNYHLLIHSNKTRFTCNDCGRKFRHPSHFKEHQRRHTGEAPFECSDCVIRFKTRNTYKRHLKTRHGKLLTQTGGIIILSEEEFRRVRTAPRSLQTRVSSDKENNRRPRSKPNKLVRSTKQKKPEGNEKNDDFVQKYSLNGNWSTNLLEPEEQVESTAGEPQTVTFLGEVGSATTVVVLSVENAIFKNITV